MNQVNNISEQDMVTFRAIFERIADTIADHSKLRQELEDLRKTIASVGNTAELQVEVERLRDENKHLKEMREADYSAHNQLVDERDNLQREVSDLRRLHGEAQTDLYRLRDELDKQAADNKANLEDLKNLDIDITKLKDELTRARSDRDAEGYKVLELTEKLDKVTAELTWANADLARITSERDTIARRLDTIKVALQG